MTLPKLVGYVSVIGALGCAALLVAEHWPEGRRSKKSREHSASGVAPPDSMPVEPRKYAQGLEPTKPRNVESALRLAPGSSEPEPARSGVDAPVDVEATDDPPAGLGSDEELGQAFDDSFEAEEFDARFEREARNTYLSAVQGSLPTTSRLLSFDCRSQFCRMRLIHDSIDTHNSFMAALFAPDRGVLAGSAQGFRASDAMPTAEGKVEFAVYIAAKGVNVALATSE